MKKKGFTLIELLAVIVILAIIALISVPIVLNMIESARKSGAKSSAYGYIEAIEYNNGLSEIEDSGYIKVEDGIKEVNSIVGLKMKGKAPTSGTVTIKDGKVESAKDLCINGYKVDYKAPEVTSLVKGCDESGKPSTPTGGPTKELPTSDKTYKAIIYLDPTDLTKICNATNSVSTTGTKVGCMKWYAYDEDSTSYKLILDHNTHPSTYWADVPTFNGLYENSSIKNEVLKLVSEQGWMITPRLISEAEIAKIVGVNEGVLNYYFDGGFGVANAINKSNYAWLYDYTGRCFAKGCNIEDNNEYNPGNTFILGYWTDTNMGNSGMIALVDYTGYVYAQYANSPSYGIRPVITIQKSIIK